VYIVLKLTVEALADGGLKLSGTFGEEIPVWEDVRTSRRFLSNANPASPTRLRTYRLFLGTVGWRQPSI
jgi:hypothetical protein